MARLSMVKVKLVPLTLLATTLQVPALVVQVAVLVLAPINLPVTVAPETVTPYPFTTLMVMVALHLLPLVDLVASKSATCRVLAKVGVDEGGEVLAAVGLMVVGVDEGGEVLAAVGLTVLGVDFVQSYTCWAMQWRAPERVMILEESTWTIVWSEKAAS